MRQSERNKRNLIIIGLCAVVAIMAVGFAAFSQQLQINSTSEVTSSWDVHIKNNGVSYKDAVAATSTLAEKTSALVATFACTLSTPGTSTISYDIIVENKGTLNAKLDSINLTGGNTAISVVTSPTNASLSTNPIVLGPDDETTITVIVSYNNINTQPTGDGAITNITATLNFSQTADSPIPMSPGLADGTYYAFNSQTVFLNSNERYVDLDENPRLNYYLSIEDCQEYSDHPTSCAPITISLEDSIGTETNWHNLNKTVFNKYVVSNGVITEASTCLDFGNFSSSQQPVCLRGGDYDESIGSSPHYSVNRGIIEDYATTGLICSSNNISGYCVEHDEGHLSISTSYSGFTSASDSFAKEECNVDEFGNARCSESGAE